MPETRKRVKSVELNHYIAVYPPSTIKCVPVMYEASSEAKNRIALATSRCEQKGRRLTQPRGRTCDRGNLPLQSHETSPTATSLCSDRRCSRGALCRPKPNILVRTLLVPLAVWQDPKSQGQEWVGYGAPKNRNQNTGTAVYHRHAGSDSVSVRSPSFG